MNNNKFNRIYIKNDNLHQQNIDENSEKIKVVQWNIFAQGFVVADNFQHCRPEELTWPKRKVLFEDELNFLDADIYCFQEADIHNQLLAILNKKCCRFQDVFVAKSESPCLLYENNFGPDGLSITYDIHKLNIIKANMVRLDNSANYIAVLIAFNFINKPDLKFILCTTHLKSKKSYKEVRAKQITKVLEGIERLSNECQINSIIFTGDFNCCPDEVTIDILRKDPMNFINVYDEFYDKYYSHSLKSSNLTNCDNSYPYPYYTTWTFRKEDSSTKRERTSTYVRMEKCEITEIIDYIWCTNRDIEHYDDSSSNTTNSDKNKVSPVSITPLSILSIPIKDDFGKYGLPFSDIYPSDHVSLAAEFIISNSSHQ